MKQVIIFNKLPNIKHYIPTQIAFKRKLFIEKTMPNQNITDRIKTFEDACAELNIDINNLTSFECNINDKDSKSWLANVKLTIIIRALNEGWKPNWHDSTEQKWYPWFNYYGGSGFVFGDTYFDSTLTHSYVGARLCFKKKTLATYAGKQFIAIYNDYLNN